MTRLLAMWLLIVPLGCGPTTPRCNTTNCVGCCDSKTDTCLAGSEVTACGKEGTLCISCPAGNLCTTSRACSPPPPDGGVRCNTSNCDGCCDDVGSCFKGTSNEACGGGGISCQVCASAMTCQRLVPSNEFGGRCAP